MTKQAKVEVRCTDEEKARWQEAAGGPRKVSAWMRSLANSHASPGMTDLMVTPESIDAALADETLIDEPVVEATKVALTPQAKIERAKEAHREGMPRRGKVIERKKQGCSRSHFHRPGVYCGTCKKIN